MWLRSRIVGDVNEIKDQENKSCKSSHTLRYDSIPEQFNVDIQNRFAELIPIVDEMTPNELWKKIKITTAKVAKVKLSRKRFQEETVDIR